LGVSVGEGGMVESARTAAGGRAGGGRGGGGDRNQREPETVKR